MSMAFYYQIILILMVSWIKYCQQVAATSTFQCTEVGELEKGDDVTICVHLDELQQKMAYRVEVDKYSAVQLVGGYNKLKSAPQQVYVQIGDHITSEGVSYGQETVVSVFSVVILLEDGRIQEIAWDNGCFGACDSNCVENTGCSQSCTGDGFECDPTIYISWMGTDSSGLHLTSSGLRLSQFASYSISKMYEEATDKIKSIDV